MKVIFSRNDVYILYALVVLITAGPFIFFRFRSLHATSSATSKLKLETEVYSEIFPIQNWYTEGNEVLDMRRLLTDFPRIMGAPTELSESGLPPAAAIRTRGLISSYLNYSDYQDFNPFDPDLRYTVWDFFHPQSTCTSMKRVGWFGDGGKWICGIEWLKYKKESGSRCVMYSFGVGTEISFETQFERYTHCEVHVFDPSVGDLPYYTENQKRYSKMFFHKVAFGLQSGSSKTHLLVESLPDIMFKLNHTYLDVLKVDVEGAEWEVFNHILKPRSKMFSSTVKANADIPLSTILPVGQLLIELHYQAMNTTIDFFHGMNEAGYVIISREINLQATKVGGKPIASEFTFINPKLYYSPIIAQHLRRSVKVQNKLYQDRISSPAVAPIKAVIYYLSQHKRVGMLANALQSLYMYFLKDFSQYPVVVFHDDFTNADISYLRRNVSGIKHLNFVRIKLKLPSNIDIDEIPERTPCSYNSSTLGYRHMCRFHATVAHEELAKAGYGNVEYIMRMDDDGALTYPVGYDMFRLMKIHNKKYGFASMLQEDIVCVRGLWPLAREYLSQTKVQVKSKEGILFDSIPDGYVFYNNFEISHASLWKSPVWLGFMRKIDESGGIYKLRWGDAPIHTIGVGITLTKKEIHAFTDIGYSHEPFIKQYPTGLPPPFADPLLPRMECSYYSTWACEVLGNLTNGTLGNGTLVGSNSSFSLTLDQALNADRIMYAIDPRTGLRTRSVVKGVLYTFGHSSMEKTISGTLINFYQQYTRVYIYPFVVFYSDSAPMLNISRVRSLVGPKLASTITFIPVNLRQYMKYLRYKSRVSAHNSSSLAIASETDPWTCVLPDPEKYAASYFFRFDAVKLLHSLGYNWYLRFASSSKLLNPVRYDIFREVVQENKLYAFYSGQWDRELCVKGLWRRLEHLCDNSTKISESRPISRILSLFRIETHHETEDQHLTCGDYFEKWQYLFTIFTNFEVSHISVWTHPVCQRIEKYTRENPQDTANWSDGVIHTGCAAGALNQTQLIRLKDVDYHFNFDRPDPIEIIDNMSRKVIRPVAPKVDIPIETYLWNSTLLSDLNVMFGPRRIGWLGSDIDTSLALPTREEVLSNSLFIQKYLWLFGDTFIGMTDGKRRLFGAHMVGNTFGIATLSNLSTVESVKFYFGMNQSSGQADHILTVNGHVLWPNGGIVIVDQTSQKPSHNKRDYTSDITMKLLIVGQLKAEYEQDGIQFDMDGALNIQEKATGSVLVNNPHSPPDDWEYSTSIIKPRSRDDDDTTQSLQIGKTRWITIVEWKGRSYARAMEGEYIYLFGDYTPAGSHKQANTFVSSLSYTAVYRISTLDAMRNNFTNLEVYCDGVLRKSSQSSKHYSDTDKSWMLVNWCLKPHQLFSPGMSEPSLHFDLQSSKWIAIGLEAYEKTVRLCRTETRYIVSNWRCAIIYDIPYPWSDESQYIVYAAKAHPELIPRYLVENSTNPDNNRTSIPYNHDDSMKKKVGFVISFISNTFKGPMELFTEDNLYAYSPQFVYLETNEL